MNIISQSLSENLLAQLVSHRVFKKKQVKPQRNSFYSGELCEITIYRTIIPALDVSYFKHSLQADSKRLGPNLVCTFIAQPITLCGISFSSID